MSSIAEQLSKVHVSVAQKNLGHLYHLEPTLKLVGIYPEILNKAFTDYVSMFMRFYRLNAQEKQIVDQVALEMGDNEHKSATVFRKSTVGHEKFILESIRELSDPGTPHYKIGIDQLATMMTAAWDMKSDNLKPKDGDPRSDGVIWGHVLGSLYPLIDVNFIMAHAGERILTAKFKDIPLQRITTKKDWSFPALTAIIGLDGVRGIGASKDLLPIWRQKRPLGLGWISEKRVQIFQEKIASL